MALIETDQLIGAALDWAVAKCEKKRVVVPKCWAGCSPPSLSTSAAARAFPYGPPKWSPSTDWAQGGPIILREKLSIKPHLVGGDWYGEWRSVCLSWEGRTYSDKIADSPLVAAMRCFVAAVIGDSVDIPTNLL